MVYFPMGEQKTVVDLVPNLDEIRIQIGDDVACILVELIFHFGEVQTVPSTGLILRSGVSPGV